MKKTIIIIFLLIIIQPCVFSQEKIVSDFKVKDIYGNAHILYDYLNSGKYVFLQFFSVGCNTCQIEAPIIDTVYKKFGCGCEEIVFLALDYGATNESVINFCKNYNATYTTVSGQDGGGNTIFELYNVGYTPYNFLIAPNKEIVEENIPFSNSQELEDLILSYGIDTSLCKGDAFLYFAIEKSVNDFLSEDLYGIISENEINIYFPENLYNNLSNIIPSFISSTLSTVFIDEIEQFSEISIINLSELQINYFITAQDNSFSKDWILKINLTEDIKEIENYISIYPNPSNGLFFYNSPQNADKIDIYNSEFKKIKDVSCLDENKIDLSELPNGIYFIQFTIDKEKIICKIIIQH